MCNPSAWIQGASAGASLIGGDKAARDAQRSSEYSASARTAEAQDALATGSFEESQYRRRIAQLIGEQKAQIGARNVQRSGTALDLIGDSAFVGEEGAQTIRRNAAREAHGLRTDAEEIRRSGKTNRRNILYQTGSSLLTQGAQAYGRWASNR